VANLLFLEEHIAPVIDDLRAVRDKVDGMIGVIADAEIIKLTKLGKLDMSQPASGLMKLLKKLRPKQESNKDKGEKRMAQLRRLPKLLKMIPGKAQDLRSWFLVMQYWLGGSDDNIEAMVRYLLGKYAKSRAEWLGGEAPQPIEYPDVALYHPEISRRITEDPADIPGPSNPVATVGLLMMRSYVLSDDTAHYDAVIRKMEASGLRVLPAFAGGLDGRPAIEAFFRDAGGVKIDAMVSLTGFSLIGGPAYNDSAAAVETLRALDVPYIAAHPLEFQTLGQWSTSDQGLGPIETTMLVALPELDGATCPTVFGGRHGPEGCKGCHYACPNRSDTKAMAPCNERIDSLVEKTRRLALLRRKQNSEKKVAIVLFGFPPNAGAVGTAAYLSVFESLYHTLHAMKAKGYDVQVPESVDALRAKVLEGNFKRYG
jgi:magnesium chelatase subunit H